MNHDLICSWLGLPAGLWPPDHYRLLGLEPGEADPERIEQQVHRRLELVRRYQLSHPEEVTEAMNRLAQAFVCLTDSQAKQTYDRKVLGKVVPEPEPAGVGPAEGPPSWLLDPPRKRRTTLADWRAEVPPVRAPARVDIPVLPSAAPSAQVEIPALPPEPVSVLETAEPAEVGKARPSGNGLPATADLPVEPGERAPAEEVVRRAGASRLARRGLGTKRKLYRRIALTRRLLEAWQAAGVYLGDPKRRLHRPAEATELIRHLARIRTLLRGFPPLLGHAGQPGYLVVSLARQQVPVPTFQTLLPSQREKLAEDWRLGQALLNTHRQFLRDELRLLRKRNSVGRMVRAVRAFLAEPGGVLLLLGLLALNLAIWRSYFSTE